MVIVFFLAKENKLCICTQQKPMQLFDVNDSNLLSFIPNDDIYYVQNCSILSKKQLQSWLNGELSIDVQENEREAEQEENDDRKFVHPTNNGTIIIPTIKSKKYPEGLKLTNKYDFAALEELGEDVEEDHIFRSLIRARKIEIVDIDYVRKNIHKANRKVSASDAELNKILIPAGRSAESVHSAGGLDVEEGWDNSLIPVKII